MNATLIVWDWKQQPDWDQINSALTRCPGARFFPVTLYSDDYAVMVAPADWTPEQAQAEADRIVNAEE